jgi:hypothetical protein
MFLTIGIGSVLLVILVVIVLYMFDKSARAQAEVNTPRLRACPVCGKELKIGENILAERTGVVRGGREKIVIKGCSYCLKKN